LVRWPHAHRAGGFHDREYLVAADSSPHRRGDPGRPVLTSLACASTRDHHASTSMSSRSRAFCSRRRTAPEQGPCHEDRNKDQGERQPRPKNARKHLEASLDQPRDDEGVERDHDRSEGAGDDDRRATATAQEQMRGDRRENDRRSDRVPCERRRERHRGEQPAH